MGHAVDNTMQDILIRTKRMQGYAALWVPGTDHASIATEAKVVEAMAKEGLTKEMVGRDGFLERAWDWKVRYGNRIVSQLKKLGSSCDWQRERFTMDEGCSDAVREVFVRLYKKGLIYRGNRNGQLVSPLQYLHLGRRGGVHRTGRPFLAPSVPGQGDRGDAGAGHHRAPRPCWAIPLWPSTPMTPAMPICTAATSSCRCSIRRFLSSATSTPT